MITYQCDGCQMTLPKGEQFVQVTVTEHGVYDPKIMHYHKECAPEAISNTFRDERTVGITASKGQW